MAATGGSFDASVDGHCSALFVWLNGWGCRQFAKKHHHTAIVNLRAWLQEQNDFRKWVADGSQVPDEAEKDAIATAYESLLAETTGSSNFGPTGAAKTLFGICPRALPPWDGGIRTALDFSESGPAYVKYMAWCREALDRLESFNVSGSCRERLSRPGWTMLKLLDEYLWVTKTRKIELPALDQVKHWVACEEHFQNAAPGDG